MRAEHKAAKSPCGGGGRAFRIHEFFSEQPESTQRQHIEVAHDGIHHVEGQVLLALLNVPKIKLLATHTGRYSSLRLALTLTKEIILCVYLFSLYNYITAQLYIR